MIRSRDEMNEKAYANNYIMLGGKLVSEGGFGCVFYPGIDCNGKIMDNAKTISKIQLADKNATNELRIGNIIKTVHGFANHFSPVINMCPIKINKIKDKNKNECGIFKKYKDTNFTLMKMLYIKGEPYSIYMINTKNKTELINNLINSYNHLLKSLAMLINKKIVHFDLKGNNILFNSEMKEPVIIDFGLSILIENLENLNNAKLKEFFYIYAPDYYIWPLEIHYLCYLLHKNSNPSDDELYSICDEFIKKNNVLNTIYSKEFLKKYTNSCYDQLKKYNNMQNDRKIIYILNTWESWDNYALSLLYLKFISYININGYYDNTFIVFFSNLLLKNIHPNPNKRFNITQSIHNFNRFFYSKNYDNNTFENITKLVIDNKKSINKALMVDYKNQKKNTFKMKHIKRSIKYDFTE